MLFSKTLKYVGVKIFDFIYSCRHTHNKHIHADTKVKLPNICPWLFHMWSQYQIILFSWKQTKEWRHWFWRFWLRLVQTCIIYFFWYTQYKLEILIMLIDWFFSLRINNFQHLSLYITMCSLLFSGFSSSRLVVMRCLSNLRVM